MAPWDEEKFELFEKRLIATMNGKRPVVDVPYYIYLYDPAEELRAIDEFQNLERRLKARGYSAEIIWMSELMIKTLERFKFLEPNITQIEKGNRASVKNDLERILPSQIALQLIEKLKHKGVEHCAILLRIGALYPFVRVSSLLNFIEGRVNCTLVIGYPGNKEGQMLNDQGEIEMNYYRAEII